MKIKVTVNFTKDGPHVGIFDENEKKRIYPSEKVIPQYSHIDGYVDVVIEFPEFSKEKVNEALELAKKVMNEYSE